MKIDMIGKRFGRLTVIAEGEKSNSRQCTWICQCDCGNITAPILGDNLRKGASKSCGCLKLDLLVKRSTRHGKSYERIYHIYAGMKNRCYNTNAPNYVRYGGRGIAICEEWLNDFQTFYEWSIENGYTDQFSIDRIDNDKGYSPDNCRWATNETQSNNKGNQAKLTINGITKTIAQWAKESGVKYTTIHARHIRGWTGESLISKE